MKGVHCSSFTLLRFSKHSVVRVHDRFSQHRVVVDRTMTALLTTEAGGLEEYGGLAIASFFHLTKLSASSQAATLLGSAALAIVFLACGLNPIDNNA